jgi:negative regulator of sigma E activity
MSRLRASARPDDRASEYTKAPSRAPQPPQEVAYEMLFKLKGALGARLALVAVLAAVFALALAGVAQAKDKRELGVMTQNLYLGSSLDAALAATTLPQFLVAANTIWGTVQATNFPVDR